MTAKEETYTLTVHLIDGTKHRVSYPVTATDLTDMYKVLGMDEGRIRYPTNAHTMHFMPTTSVLRLEATGDFD